MNAPPRRFGRAVIALGVAVLAGWLGSRVTLDDDLGRLLPDTDPETVRVARAATRLMTRMLVDVHAADGAVGPAEIGAAADQLAAALRATGHVRRVQARIDPDALLPAVDLMRDRAALLLEPRQLDALVPALEPERAIATVRTLAHRIQQVDGAHLKTHATVDPLALTGAALAPLAGLGETFGAARIVGGRITSSDGRHVLVLVQPRHAPDDAARSEGFLTAVEAAFADVARSHPGVRIRFAGAHRATIDNVRQIKVDVARTSLVGVAGVGLLAVLCFGRIWLALLALTPALFGGVCAWGVFALFRDSTAGAVLGFGAVLLGLSIDFAVHVLFRLDRSKSGAPAALPVRALALGGTTTSLAFVALQASSLPALRDVGIFGAVGIVAAVLFALLVLPVLAPRSAGPRPILDLRRVVRHLGRPAVPAVVIALLATPILAAGWWFLEFEGDPTRLGALSSAAADDDAVIQRIWGPPGQTSALVIEHSDLETALRENDRLRASLDARVAAGTVRRHASVAGLLPAATTQRRRLQAWRAFWNADRVAALRRTLDQATAATLFRDGSFAPFLAWIERDPPLLDHAEVTAGPMGDLLADRIQKDGELWRISTPVFTDTWEQTAALRAALQADHPGVLFLNRQAVARELASMVTGEIGWLGLIAFLLVGAVVYLWHGRILITAAILLPLLLSLVWTLGLLGWCGVQISLANAIFVVLLFGIAVDYAIFLASSRLDRFRTGTDRVEEAQASVLLCTLTTCAGFGAVALAGHPVLHSIGLTALVGIFAAATTTQVFVPALTAALLLRHGPNGTPGWRNARAGFWVFRMMATRGVWHLLTRDRGPDTPERQAAAIDCIHRMGVRIRTRIPGSRAQFIDTGKLLAEPCVLVANHESMFDIMAVLALPKRTQLLVKGWVWRMPLMGHMVRAAGYILAQESDPDEVFRHAAARIRQGNSLLVFPEGRRSRDGRIGRFHNGAFAIARALGVKVQPIAMVGTRQVVPPGSWWIGDHDARVCVLDPLDPEDFPGEGGDRRMAREVRDRIRTRRGELWLDTQLGPHGPQMVGGMYRYLGPVIGHYAASKCRRDPLVAALPRLCGGSGPVLVAGCGVGVMTARLALAFPERPMTGVDIDANKLRIARAALGTDYPVEFVAADLRTHPLPAAELALLVDVLHYWDEPAQRQILARVHAALEPGGTLLFRDGCAGPARKHGWVHAGEALALRTGFTRRQETLLFHTAEKWRRLLEAAGFAVGRERHDLGALSNVVWVCRRRATP